MVPGKLICVNEVLITEPGKLSSHPDSDGHIAIILPSKKVGDTVNVEVDVLGKYSEQAWEAFVPKMEALETKVKQLEARLLLE